MPTTYVGDATGLDVDDDVEIDEPVDADPGNAATFALPYEQLADRIKLLQVASGMLAKARTWTTLQTFSAGIAATTAALSGALTAASAAISGALSAASASISGAITGASLNVSSGAISGGAISGSSLNVGGGALTAGAVSLDHALLTGSDPAVGAELAARNRLDGLMVPRAFGRFTRDGGATTHVEGLNMTAAIAGNPAIVIGNIGWNMLDTNYAIWAYGWNHDTGKAVIPRIDSRTAGGFQMTCFHADGTNVDGGSCNMELDLIVMGRAATS
jgi:hypothetical protein